MNAKKILIVTAALFALSLGALLTYNAFFKEKRADSGNADTLPSAPPTRGGENSFVNPPNSDKTTSGVNGQNAISDMTALKIKPVSQEKVLSPTIGQDGQTVKYFSRTSGNVYQSDFNGNNLKKISSVNLNNLLKVLWSPDKEKVIGIFQDQDKIKKYFYDYTSNQTAVYDDKINYLAWSPDSKKIAYHFINPQDGQNNVSVANPNGANWKNIFKTRLDNLIIEWPVKEKISLRLPPGGLAQNVLYSLNPETGDFFKVISDTFGLIAKWSPKGDKVLFSATNSQGKNPRLHVGDEKGANFKNLNLAGLADKCVWSKDDKTIFCALPQEISQNAVWPDDYYKGLLVLRDDIYKIDLETEQKTKILGSSDAISYDVQEPFLSPKEDYLFFVNRGNGLLYSLKTQ